MSVKKLKEIFKQHFHCDPQYLVRCPGRVNLIGEHIDYSGYGVFPMAIDAATYVLVSYREQPEIAFYNTDQQYPPFVHKLDAEWIGRGKPQWYQYFLCGWKGMHERLHVSVKGLNVLVSGCIPPCSGLSSSSSIVCASALATLAMHTSETFEVVSRAELAELCARAERYIGTEGGGMDQAIEILAVKGSAMLIEFNPLQWTAVKLPDEALFAVVHCGATLNKAATSHYNQRVVECRIAAQMIAKLSGVEDWKMIRTLGELARKLDKSANEMTSVMAFLDVDCCQCIAISARQNVCYYQIFMLCFIVQEFKLEQRAMHVFSEASRVLHFRDASNKGDIHRMGALMNESHESCRSLYECSCEELDRTVQECLHAGALGARLTGAGWGGCVVALFTKRQPNFNVLFWSQPGEGIRVEKCDDF
ncbi:unnamed protein product [Toxocara canis]|uniref:Galactokinase n=1 Tax=Toxocara canis TaxID=6265 RepID=A0A183UJY1_TOXCA|nr:unnamed protein product [Toxocara canis]